MGSALQGSESDRSQTRAAPSTAAEAPNRAVQRKGRGRAERLGSMERNVQRIADSGTSGGGGSLPHLDRIQQSFGSHDVSSVQAHVGGNAAKASEAIGAEAYATGNSVAFREAPSLHTAAHEAAHVVQQRSGVHLKGGVGAAGDRYEAHADRVADAVVRGESAESLLGASPSGGGSGVQRKDSGPHAGAAADGPYADLETLHQADAERRNAERKAREDDDAEDYDDDEKADLKDKQKTQKPLAGTPKFGDGEKSKADIAKGSNVFHDGLEYEPTRKDTLPDGSSRVVLGNGVEAVRVGTGSRVVLKLVEQQKGQLYSTDFSDCGATVIKMRGNDGATYLMLSHVSATDKTGHFGRLKEDIAYMKTLKPTEMEVHLSVRSTARGPNPKEDTGNHETFYTMPSDDGVRSAVEKELGDVPVKVTVSERQTAGDTHLVVTPDGIETYRGEFRKQKLDPAEVTPHGGAAADPTPEVPANKPPVDATDANGGAQVRANEEPARPARVGPPNTVSAQEPVRPARVGPPNTVSAQEPARPARVGPPNTVSAQEPARPARVGPPNTVSAQEPARPARVGPPKSVPNAPKQYGRTADLASEPVRSASDNGVGGGEVSAQGVRLVENEKGELTLKEDQSRESKKRLAVDVEKGRAGAEFDSSQSLSNDDGSSSKTTQKGSLMIGPSGGAVDYSKSRTDKPAEGEAKTRGHSANAEVNEKGELTLGSGLTWGRGDDNKNRTWDAGVKVDTANKDVSLDAKRTWVDPRSPGKDMLERPSGKTSLGGSLDLGVDDTGRLDKLGGGLSLTRNKGTFDVSFSAQDTLTEPAKVAGGWAVTYKDTKKGSGGAGYQGESASAKGSAHFGKARSVTRNFPDKGEAQRFYRHVRDGGDPAAFKSASGKPAVGDQTSNETSGGVSGTGTMNFGAAKVSLNVGYGLSHGVSTEVPAENIRRVTITDTATLTAGLSAGALVSMGFTHEDADTKGVIVTFDLSKGDPVKKAYEACEQSGGRVLPPKGMQGVKYQTFDKKVKSFGVSAGVPLVSGSRTATDTDVNLEDEEGNQTQVTSTNVSDRLQGTTIPGSEWLLGKGVHIGPKAGSDVGYTSVTQNGESLGGVLNASDHSDDVDDFARRQAASTGGAPASEHLTDEKEDPAKVTSDVNLSGADEKVAIDKIIAGQYDPLRGAEGVTVDLKSDMAQLRKDLRSARGDPHRQRQLLRDFVNEHDKDARFQLLQLSGKEAVPVVEGHERVFGGVEGLRKHVQEIERLQRMAEKGSPEFLRMILQDAQRERGNVYEAMTKLTDTTGYLTSISPDDKQKQIGRYKQLLEAVDGVITRVTAKMEEAGLSPKATPELAAARANVMAARKRLSEVRAKITQAREEALNHHHVHEGHGASVPGSAKGALTGVLFGTEDGTYESAGLAISQGNTAWTKAVDDFGGVAAFELDIATLAQCEGYLKRLDRVAESYSGAGSHYGTATRFYADIYARNKDKFKLYFTGYQVTSVRGATLQSEDPWDPKTGGRRQVEAPRKPRNELAEAEAAHTKVEKKVAKGVAQKIPGAKARAAQLKELLRIWKTWMIKGTAAEDYETGCIRFKQAEGFLGSLGKDPSSTAMNGDGSAAVSWFNSAIHYFEKGLKNYGSPTRAPEGWYGKKG